MKIYLLLMCFLITSLLAGKEKEIIAYLKNCAVTPEGALLEEVWQVIPDEEFLRTEDGKNLPGKLSSRLCMKGNISVLH